MSKLSRKINDYMKRFPEIVELTIKDSDRNQKRFVAHFKNKKDNKYHTVHFGQKNAITFFDDSSLISKKNAYKARASKITNKNNEYTYNKAGSANSFAFYVLW